MSSFFIQKISSTDTTLIEFIAELYQTVQITSYKHLEDFSVKGGMFIARNTQQVYDDVQTSSFDYLVCTQDGTPCSFTSYQQQGDFSRYFDTDVHYYSTSCYKNILLPYIQNNAVTHWEDIASLRTVHGTSVYLGEAVRKAATQNGKNLILTVIYEVEEIFDDTGTSQRHNFPKNMYNQASKGFLHSLGGFEQVGVYKELLMIPCTLNENYYKIGIKRHVWSNYASL